MFDSVPIILSMRDDSFRPISPDEAGDIFVGLRWAAALSLILWAGIVAAILISLDRNIFGHDEVTPKLVAEASDRKAIKPTELCISQYGPGARWYASSSNPLECASAAGAVPNHILSMPITESK